MDMSDVRRLFGTLTAPESQDGYGLEPDSSGMFGYERALRVFFEWLDEQEDSPDFGFWVQIELPSGSRGRVNEEELLEEEEITQLKEAATNSRDKTLIEFLADTAARISMASQLRIGDIHELDGERPFYTPNEEGINYKVAPDKRYPFTIARPSFGTTSTTIT